MWVKRHCEYRFFDEDHRLRKKFEKILMLGEKQK